MPLLLPVHNQLRIAVDIDGDERTMEDMNRVISSNEVSLYPLQFLFTSNNTHQPKGLKENHTSRCIIEIVKSGGEGGVSFFFFFSKSHIHILNRTSH